MKRFLVLSGSHVAGKGVPNFAPVVLKMDVVDDIRSRLEKLLLLSVVSGELTNGSESIRHHPDLLGG